MKSQFLIVGALALVVGTAAWADPSVDTHSVDTVKGHNTFETPNGNTVEVRRVGQTDGEGNVRAARQFRVTDEEGEVVARGADRVRKNADGEVTRATRRTRTDDEGNVRQRRARGHKDGEGNARVQRQRRKIDGDGNVVGRSSTRVRKHGDVTQRRVRRSRT